MKTLIKTVTTVLVLTASLNSYATLIDRGNGLIYDTDQDITWLQDANYAQTSGYDADGLMTWDEATHWASNLTFSGYDDWRLVDKGINDANCSLNDSATANGGAISYFGFNCSGGDLGHLFYNDFGLTAGQSILDSLSPNLNLFTNVQAQAYWLNTAPASNNSAPLFNAANGAQMGTIRTVSLHSWAIRSGDVSIAQTIPEPSVLILFGLGFLSLRATQKRFRSA